MAQAMQEVQRSVMCAICLEVWTRPKTLPCDHVFCEECLSKICTNNGRLVKCPECRKVHLVPSDGIRDSWPTQRVLNNVADGLRSMGVQKPPVPLPRSSSLRTSLEKKATPPVAPKPSIVIPQKADPLRSYVEKHNIERIQVGELFSITTQLCDGNGRVMAAQPRKDNFTAFVDLKVRQGESLREEIQPTLTSEGKYKIEYQVKRVGIHVVNILLQNEVMNGSPVTIYAGPRGIRGCEIKGPLKSPLDIVEYGGNFIVTDSAAKAIFVIDQAGREIRRLKVQKHIEQNFLPMAITISQNQVYVTDMNNKCVHFYENVDAFPKQFGRPHLQRPTGIAVSSCNGNVFIVDMRLKQILSFNRSFQFLQALYLQTFSTGSKRQGKHQERLYNPYMMTINRTGDKLFVADQNEDGHIFIKIVSLSNLTLERKIHLKLCQNQAQPFGVALDQNENIFVSVQIQTKYNNSTGNVVVCNSNGDYLGRIGHKKSQRLQAPVGLLVTSSDLGTPSVAYVVDAYSMNPKGGSLIGFII